MTYLLVALGAVAVYLLLILPWRQRLEDSEDFERQLRSVRNQDSPPAQDERVEPMPWPERPRPPQDDPEEPPGDEDGLPEPPPWPTEAEDPADLEPVVALHTGDIGLSMMLMLRLQAEGIAYQEMGEVWGLRQILVARRHRDDVRRILEELRRDVRGS